MDTLYNSIYTHMYIMTRTCAEELATHRVYMNSIDTGELYTRV